MIRPFRNLQPQVHPTAFVEASAQVIGDVTIGEQSSVWFNAVVRGDVFHIRIGNRTNIQDGTVVPPRSLVMGVPARVKRPLSDEEVAGLDVFWKNYVEYTRVYREEYGIADV